MKKTLLVFIMLSLTITSFSNEKENVKEQKKLEINQSEKRDYQNIRTKWAEYLTGVPNNKADILKMDKNVFADICATNEKGADSAYENFVKDNNRTTVFKNFPNMGDGVHVMNNYREILKIAKAYITPNTKYYKNPEVKEDIITSLDWLYDNAYHEGLPENGNWWQWELGIPKALNDILVIMYDDVPSEKRIKYLKASQYFQPYAQYSGVSPSATYSTGPDKRVSTGGNRTDTSIISFLRGVLMEDKVQVVDGAKAVVEVGEYTTEKDGFYKDGSFIQHGNVAYNGTYASVLFDGLGAILWLADGTQFEVKDDRVNNVYSSILNGYKYLFINGGINDSVSGRAISRDNSNDIERARDILTSMGLFVDGAGEPYKSEMKALVKTVIKNNNSYNVVEKINIPKVRRIMEEIVNDNSIKTIEVEGTKVYGAMDRAVSINDKKGKVVVSMHSSRIANYETMNGENRKGWYLGDGMTYIYGIDSKAFTEYWPTVDSYHLPGVTNSLKERNYRSGERRPLGLLPSKAWVGGSGNGNEAFVGMDMISWNKATVMKKSYFMTDDGATLVVASNINSYDGEVHTTIDNRIMMNPNAKILLNGKEITEDTMIDNPKNVALNFKGNYKGENIGYKIVYAPQLTIKKVEREGTWKEIGGKINEPIKKTYFTAYINHGENPRKDGFAYVLLPMFNKDEVNQYDTSRFDIIKLDDEAHIIKDKKSGTVGINFWKDVPMKEEGIKTYASLSVIKKESKDFVDLWVSEPTQLSKYNSIFEIDGNYEVVESSTKDIKTSSKENRLRVEINLRNNGSSEHIRLRKI